MTGCEQAAGTRVSRLESRLYDMLVVGSRESVWASVSSSAKGEQQNLTSLGPRELQMHLRV